MTDSGNAEFRTVDLILASDATTRGVDAFSLAWIKAERQIRRLVTYLIFQFPCFSYADIPALKQALWNSNRVYFEGFEKGFDALWPRTLPDLVGASYRPLRNGLAIALEHRNKIFHGQLTSESLGREDLVGIVRGIREWCSAVADAAQHETGYDGFARDSFRKSGTSDLASRFKLQLRDIDSYELFIHEYLDRPRR